MQPGDFKNLLRRTVVAPVLLLALLALVLAGQVTYLNHAIDELAQTNHFTLISRQVLKNMLDMETGLRGYLLTDDSQFLAPYSDAQKNLPPILQELEQAVSKQPARLSKVQTMRADCEQWVTYSGRMIALRESGTAYTDNALNREGKRLMDRIRVQRDVLVEDFERERERRTAHVHTLTTWTLFSLAVLSAITALTLISLTRRRMIALLRDYQLHLDEERRKKIEAREAREWMLTILRSIGEGVVVVDANGRIELMNSVAEQLAEQTQQESLSKPFLEVVSLDDEAGNPILPASSLSSLPRQLLLRRRDGAFLNLEQVSSPIFDPSGRTRGTVIVIRDITERRRAETLLRSSERLATIGRLSATIAHEIRNPLEAVLGLVYLMEQNSGLTDEQRGLLSSTQDELNRITQITAQLLSFNREAREPVQLNISELLDGVLQLYGPKLGKSKINIHREFSPDAEVKGMPGELRQVFSNLIANAIDALGPEGGDIQIRVESSFDYGDEDRPGVRVIIADNGPGIPEQARKPLFTPFFTTKGERGTGLGLWVSRGIVEKHQGTMRFKSSTKPQHHGTVFSVFLPRTPRTATAKNAA